MKNFVKSLKRKNVLMCILIILGSVFLLNFLSVKEGFPHTMPILPGRGQFLDNLPNHDFK